MGSRRIVLLAVIALAGCASYRPRGLDAQSPYWGAIRSADVARGRQRFEIVCAPCHVQHQMREAPALAGLGWSPAELRHQVREGSVVMPAIPSARLRDDDLESLLAYLVTTRTVIDGPIERTGARALGAPVPDRPSLSASPSPPPPRTAPPVLDRPPPQARDTVGQWTPSQLVPAQRWAAVPGRVIGLLFSAGTQPWGRTVHPGSDPGLVAERTEYRFVTGASSPWALYFVSDGRGENFIQMSGAERTYDVAMFRPDTPNAWGLGRSAHLVELEVDGGRGGVADSIHFIATDVRVLDGTDGYPRDVSATLLALRRRFDVQLAADGFEDDASAIGAVFRADVAALQARTADGTDAGTDTTVTVHPTWDADARRLVVTFLATRSAARVVVREEPWSCPPGAPCAPPRPPEPETHRGGVQLAIRYEVDAEGTVVRETTYAARPLSP